MANTFPTPTAIAQDAAIYINDFMGAANLLSRDNEAIFTGSKVGDTVDVKVEPTVSDASEFVSTTSASAATVSTIPLKLEKWFYKRIDLTSKELALEVDDLMKYVITPQLRGIAQSINKYAIQKLQVFRHNLVGAVGTRPSSVAHIVAGTTALNALKLRKDGRVALIDNTVEASLLQLAQFTSADYGVDSPAAIREMSIGRKFGMDWFADADLGAFTRSLAANDIAGSPVVHVTGSIGDTTINIDGVTNATGTIYAGTVFTITGDTTRYVITEDITAVGNAYTGVKVYPPMVVAPDDGDAVTFEAAGYQNVLFHPSAISLAVVAPVPLFGMQSVVQNYNGIQVRVSQDGSISTLANSIVIDCFVGAAVNNYHGGAYIGA